MKNLNINYIECACYAPEHAIRFTFDESDGELYAEVQLIPVPWYKRIWRALKYIFNYNITYGYFDCTIINPEQYDGLIDIIIKAKNYKYSEKSNEKSSS